MRSGKKFFLVITLLVMMTIVMILEWKNRHDADLQARQLPFFPGFSAKTCSRLLFIERTDTARLERKGSAWFLTSPVIPKHPQKKDNSRPGFFSEFPAESASVQKALEAIGNLKQEQLVSRNPSKQAGLGVDSANALFVEAIDSSGVLRGSMYVGNAGGVENSYFVRAKNSNDVYCCYGPLRFNVFADPKRWAEKNIIKFDGNLVVKLTIASADSGTIELVKAGPSPGNSGEKDQWEIVAPVKAKAGTHSVALLLDAFAHFKTVEYEGNAALTDEDMGFTRPSVAVTATLASGETKRIIIGKNKVAMKWIRNPEKPDIVFTVYGYSVSVFNPGVAALKDTTDTGVTL